MASTIDKRFEEALLLLHSAHNERVKELEERLAKAEALAASFQRLASLNGPDKQFEDSKDTQLHSPLTAQATCAIEGTNFVAASARHQLPEAARLRLNDFAERIRTSSPQVVGYPTNQDFSYAELTPFLSLMMNNIGDPFVDSICFRENSFEFEREVLAFFAKCFSTTLEECWGYVTSGGTEGNMFGLALAKEALRNPVVLYSEHTHYSCSKIIRAVGVRSIMIRGLANGEMDINDLREVVKVLRDVPIIIFANIGTTMHGAVDNLPAIHGVLKELRITEFYIHADAALSGMILPFVDNPQPFAFETGLVDSIAVSGHKFIGSPVPCGVVLAKRIHVNKFGRQIEYIGTHDVTISGSRSGLSPLILWCAIQKKQEKGFRESVTKCLEMADYCIERLVRLGVSAWRHKNSVTVVCPNPGMDVITHWQMAPQGDMSHIIVMPQHTREIIDRLSTEVAQALHARPVAARSTLVLQRVRQEIEKIAHDDENGDVDSASKMLFLQLSVPIASILARLEPYVSVVSVHVLHRQGHTSLAAIRTVDNARAKEMLQDVLVQV